MCVLTADVVETATELGLDVEPDDGTDVLRARGETWTDEELLLREEQRKGFLEMASPLRKGAVKTVESTTRDWACSIHLVDRGAAGFERMASNFERSLWRKCYQTTSKATKKFFMKGRSMSRSSLLSYFKKLPQPPQPSEALTLISQQPWKPRQDPPPAERLWLAESSDDGQHFSAIKYFLIKV